MANISKKKIQVSEDWFVILLLKYWPCTEFGVVICNYVISCCWQFRTDMVNGL